MDLNDRKWKSFDLSGENGLFENYHGKRITKNKRIDGSIPLLTAGEQNQGVAQFISNSNIITFEEFISIDMFGNAFYHDHICCGDDNIYFFVNNNISKHSKLFIVNCINKNKSKYSYGKQFRQRNADNEKVMLPVANNDETKPDWIFMDKYIEKKYKDKEKAYKRYIEETINGYRYEEIETLEDMKWEEFFLVELFPRIQRGKRLTKTNQINGTTPYVSSTALNNGVDNYVSNKNNVRIFSDCLTIANSGSVGASFYQPFKFVASDHITHLKNDKMNKYIYLFISTLTNRLSDKYNFNREINDKRIAKEKKLLPIDTNGNPNFKYMEQYVKNIIVKNIKQSKGVN